LRAKHVAAVDGVEAVALAEEPFERARLGMEGRARRAVMAAEGASRLLGPDTLVDDLVAAALRAHPGAEVRQAVRPARHLDGDRARSVEAEEPDPGLAARRHVRAHVQLEEGRRERQRQ